MRTIFPSIALSLLLSLGAGKNLSMVVVSQTIIPAHTSSHAELLALAVKLVKGGNIEQALLLFDRAIQVAEAIPIQASRIEALCAIALQLAEVGQTKRERATV